MAGMPRFHQNCRGTGAPSWTDRAAIHKRWARGTVAYLIADKLNQGVFIKLRGEGLGDAIYGDQLSGTFTDLVLSLVDDQNAPALSSAIVVYAARFSSRLRCCSV
jgi:hypothetical protein